MNTQELLIRMALESIFIVILIWLVIIKSGLIEVLKPLGSAKHVILGFLLFWSTVQCIDRWQYHYPNYRVEFFPLVRFAMYSFPQKQESFVTYTVHAEYDDGKIESLNPVKLLSGSNAVTINSRFGKIVKSFQSPSLADNEWSLKQSHLFLKSFYNILLFKKSDIPCRLSLYSRTISLQQETIGVDTLQLINSLKYSEYVATP